LKEGFMSCTAAVVWGDKDWFFCRIKIRRSL
jgi:hypothetical protein